MQRIEYVSYLTSRNRDLTKDQANPANPTNGIVVPLNMPDLRMQFTHMTLGSAELPLSQYLIESTGNTLYFDDGIRLIVNDVAEECRRTFTLTVDDQTYEILLPPYLNHVIDVDDSVPAAPIFTTQYAHALDLNSQWNWGLCIQLIGTHLGVSAATNLCAANVNFLVLNATQFQISGLTPGAWPSRDGIYGYVWAPAIPSPQYLATILQYAIDLEIPRSFALSYSLTTGQFTLTSLLTSTTCARPAPPTYTPVIYVTAQSSECLSAMMGFGTGRCQFQSPPSSCAVPTPNLLPCAPAAVLHAGYGYQCVMHVPLALGNYGPDSLVNQLNASTHRLYFEPGCSPQSGTEPMMVFANAEHTCFSISITWGYYTPQTFCQFVQSAMIAADPLGQPYECLYDAATGQFCFTTSDSSVFSLEFGDLAETLNAQAIGFDNISYRGLYLYCSTTPVFFPQLTCCNPGRYLGTLVQACALTHQRKFQFTLTQSRGISLAQITDEGGGTAFVVCSIAHGYQVYDPVALVLISSHSSVILPVTAVINAFTFAVNLAGTSIFDGAVDAPVTCNLADLPLWNFYLAPTRPQVIPARILGFIPEDLLWLEGTLTYLSPYVWALDPPSYILLCVTETNALSHSSHTAGSVVNPNVFAKIILAPSVRVERLYPMMLSATGLAINSAMRFTFYNNDGTLYQMHGLDWSLTLLFSVPKGILEVGC